VFSCPLASVMQILHHVAQFALATRIGTAEDEGREVK
jgi:hypothetical protein